MATNLAKAEAKLQNLRHRLMQAREDYAETVTEGVGAVVAVGAGFALGAAEERWGEDALFGTSVPMVAGVLLTGAALAGYGGEARMVMLEAGKAGLVIEAYKGGSRVTRDWLAEPSEP